MRFLQALAKCLIASALDKSTTQIRWISRCTHFGHMIAKRQMRDPTATAPRSPFDFDRSNRNAPRHKSKAGNLDLGHTQISETSAEKRWLVATAANARATTARNNGKIRTRTSNAPRNAADTSGEERRRSAQLATSTRDRNRLQADVRHLRGRRTHEKRPPPRRRRTLRENR